MEDPNMMPAPTASHPAHLSNGGRLVAVDGRALPLVAAAIAADARGGVARVELEQRFRNAHDVPLAVTYSLPLPPDAAVSGFEFRIGERRIVGEVDKRAAARERFERAIVEGKTAAILEQDRSVLFTQEIANVPPGTEIVARVTIDQRLRWLDEGAWEWRFPTTAAPRYLGEAGRVPDAARITQDVADGPLPVRMTLALHVRDAMAPGRAPESPSHRVRAEGGRVTLMPEPADDASATRLAGPRPLGDAGQGGVPLDRDVVVRWTVAEAKVGVSVDVARPAAGTKLEADAYALITIVPPRPDARAPVVPRDLVVLIDTSGSMSGEPLDQARRIVGALVDTLGDGDSLQMIEFADSPRRWTREPVAANAYNRKSAHAWLGKLRASGSTEMRTAIVEALAPLRAETQRQVVLVTDGQIGFESEVVAEIAARLAPASRVHTVGVGSAVNRALTGGAARAGRGVEVVAGIGEDPERAAKRIVARTNAPVVVDLEIAGEGVVELAPRRLPDLFAGAPVLVGVRTSAAGGDVVVRGRTASGAWEARVRVPRTEPGEGAQGVVALFGRETVEDREMDLAAGAEARVVDAEIERIGLAFAIATRMTSWVAVDEEASVDPRSPLKRVRMPHELPHGMSVEGLGLRAYAAAPPLPMAFIATQMAGAIAPQAAFMPARVPPAPQSPAPAAGKPPSVVSRFVDTMRAAFGGRDEEGEKTMAPTPAHLLEQRAAVPTTTPTGAAERKLRGRVVALADGTLVVEVIVDGSDLAWSPDTHAEVDWTDGTHTREAIDLTRTTRAGLVRAGESLRIAIAARAGATPKSLTLASGGERIVLVL
jgi:Ca-activated chloride channel family protein